MSKNSQFGRSMIEMLGVLAIIAVLSVGGIAGYSKAMEKFKVNKTISEYNTLMFGFFQHIDDIRKTNVDKEDYNSLFVALDMVPKSWTLEGQYFVDDMGNYIRIYPTYIEIMFNYLGKSGGFKKNSFCHNLFELAKGYQNELIVAYVWKANKQTDIAYYGNRRCGGNEPCIKDMTFNDIDKQCQICNKIDEHTCSLVLKF